MFKTHLKSLLTGSQWGGLVLGLPAKVEGAWLSEHDSPPLPGSSVALGWEEGETPTPRLTAASSANTGWLGTHTYGTPRPTYHPGP